MQRGRRRQRSPSPPPPPSPPSTEEDTEEDEPYPEAYVEFQRHVGNAEGAVYDHDWDVANHDLADWDQRNDIHEDLDAHTTGDILTGDVRGLYSHNWQSLSLTTTATLPVNAVTEAKAAVASIAQCVIDMYRLIAKAMSRVHHAAREGKTLLISFMRDQMDLLQPGFAHNWVPNLDWAVNHQLHLQVRIRGIIGMQSHLAGNEYAATVFIPNDILRDINTNGFVGSVAAHSFNAVRDLVDIAMEAAAQLTPSPPLDIPFGDRPHTHDDIQVAMTLFTNDVGAVEQQNVDAEVRIGGRYKHNPSTIRAFNALKQRSWDVILSRSKAVWAPFVWEPSLNDCLIQCCLRQVDRWQMTAAECTKRWGLNISNRRKAEIQAECAAVSAAVGHVFGDFFPESLFEALQNHLNRPLVIFNSKFDLLYIGNRHAHLSEHIIRAEPLYVLIEGDEYSLADGLHCVAVDPSKFFECGRRQMTWCYYCHIRHSDPNHICGNGMCPACGGPDHGPNPGFSLLQFCDQCNVGFRSGCWQAHLASRDDPNSACRRFWYCSGCDRKLSRHNDPMASHECGQHRCQICRQYAFMGHVCMLNAPLVKSVDIAIDQNKQLVAWDCECYVSGKHEVYHVTACMVFGDDRHVYTFSTIDAFMQWVMHLPGFTFVAHNSANYDSYFVIEWLLKNEIRYNVIRQGSSISGITLPASKIRFADSVRWFKCRLSRLPHMFGFANDPDANVKGWFPHKFASPEHSNYVGPIPPISDFFTDNMSVDEWDEFKAWHSSWEGKEWSYSAELNLYASADSRILAKALERYHGIMHAICGFSPLSQFTLASTAMRHFITSSKGREVRTVDRLGTVRSRPHEIPILGEGVNAMIRTALSGGRTDVRELFWECPEGWRATAADVVSMYPSRQMKCPYPYGVPSVTRNTALTPLNTWADIEALGVIGIVCVDVTPPASMYLPALRTKNKESGKLETSCNPIKAGAYTTTELMHAMLCGYVITGYWWAIMWKEQTTDLFAHFFQTWFALKAEAEGYPADVITEEQKREYVEQFKLDNAGVQLNPDNIKVNKELRESAKAVINVLWGRFAFILRSQCRIVGSRLELFKMFEDPKIEITDVNIISDTFAEVTFKTRTPTAFDTQEMLDPNSNPMSTAVALAVFTTSHASTLLHKALLCLYLGIPISEEPQDFKNIPRNPLTGCQILGFDTDSAIVAYRIGHFPKGIITSGRKNLGTFVCEIPSDCYISKWVAAGPKSYYYEVRKIVDDTLVKNVSKFKGITQSRTNVLDASLYEDLVVRGKTITTVSEGVKKHRATNTLTSHRLTRQIRITYDKSETVYTQTGLGTRPFGFDGITPFQ